MAKARKGKNEEQKGDNNNNNNNSEAVVRHQKLCLSIDIDKRRIYGYTELDIVVPDDGIVCLHIDNLVIDSVTVDGEVTEFQVFPHYLPLENGDRWCSVSSTTSAADAAGSVYLSSLDRELVSNLLIMCSKPEKHEIEESQEVLLENGVNSSAENNQNVRKVRIDYWVEKAETGIHCDGDVLHTDNQIRRARCWFPCMDDSLQCCCYDMEFTVASNLVAVSTGTLLYQIWTNDVPARKTYVYRLSTPVCAQWISLAVAPFEILQDPNITQLSHICLPADSAKLRHTMGFFHSAFSHYEDYLSASFPFGSYTQVFISPEIAISSLSLGASMSIFSSQLLFDEKVIDQTIETRIKLAYALARQWFGVYITPEAPNDDWLLDGLAGFLTDIFIKRFLGNNEARYRRYKANIAVCRADDSGATALSAVASSMNLYGTHCIGFFGKIRSWKSVAIVQMLEKQMGPESFRKILQQIVSRAQDANRSLRTLSAKEFRHLANKVGNLERPFLKEFFPRWVGSCGCPVLKMGFSYNKRKNIVELAILRECTSRLNSSATMTNGKLDSEKQEGDVGWPGMMSIRVHELDGMYDHPILPMTGEPCQLLEIQCHSRLAAKRFQKPKKGSKPDGSDDNGDIVANVDMRATSDSPLLWLRADPELEYLAEIHFTQPVQMWINQLEKDRDVVAQAQAIATLKALPQLSFSVVNALNNLLTDSKAFWRIRIEAAYALANTASEETDWAGLIHLITYYKSRRFDANIGLPKPNDFHDFQEYFVLEAIPHAIAMVRAADGKSPREAVEFVLQLLKYNDNSGNPYSDVFWLAALVQSIGELEFGQQSIVYLSSLLKRVDRLLQFDRLMPSYNGILTISCIRSLTQIAIKLSEFVPLDRVIELISPFRASTTWKVRVEASRSLLDLEFQRKDIDAALTLFIRYLDEEPTIRGQVKLGVHSMRLCQIRNESDSDSDVKSETLVALLRLLESPISFNNVILRHYLFCILQVLARRAPTLYGVSRDETLMGHAGTLSEVKKFFAAIVKPSKPPEPPLENLEGILDGSVIPEAPQEADVLLRDENANGATSILPDSLLVTEFRKEADDALLSDKIVNTNGGAIPDGLVVTAVQNEADPPNSRHEVMHPAADLPLATSSAPYREEPGLPDSNEQPRAMVSLLHETAVTSVGPPAADVLESHDQGNPVINLVQDSSGIAEPSKERDPVINLVQDSSGIAEPSRERDTVSASHERKKPVFKIKVKKPVASSRAEDHENATVDKSQDCFRDVDRGASSSVSVDAPQRNVVEILSSGNQFPEDVNSCHDVGSHVTASIGSVKVATDGEELTKELQCTADSSKVSLVPRPDDHLSTGITRHDDPEVEPHKYGSLHSLTMPNLPVGKMKEKKKDRGKKRKLEGRKDDPEYLERKRLKKEKKRKEKEMKKLVLDEAKASTSVESQRKNEQRSTKAETIRNDHKASLVELDSRKDEAELRQVLNGVEAKATSSNLYSRNEDAEAKGASVQLKPGGSSGVKINIDRGEGSVNAPPPSSHKLKIRIKNRTLGKS